MAVMVKAQSPDRAAHFTVIETAVKRLKALSQRSLQHQWHYSQGNLTLASVQQQGSRWSIAPVNQRDHVAWGRGQQQLWLWQHLVIPETCSGFEIAGSTLRLGLTWWAEFAQVFVDGQLVQEGDLYDCFTRILLGEDIQLGDEFTVALHLVSPGHDDGALVRSQLIYESPDPNHPEPGFVADEIAVLAQYFQALAPEQLAPLAAAVERLDLALVENTPRFRTDLVALRQRLMPWSDWIKQYQITCVGHAHLDLAWLWPVAETWEAAERTFKSVLALQQDFPELTYTHSSPALFAWLEQHRPDLFAAVQQAVDAGWWTIDAGLWVEPELNTVGGESLARQILYGQQYCRDRFGDISAIAWLPDSFGFSAQLPQLLKQGGIRCFATQKLRWNDTTEFPHHLFNWQGPDGTQLLSMTLPPIGSDIDPVKMAEQGATWADKTDLTTALWLPGMGDHGGGPTRDMLEQVRRWQRSPFFPEVRFQAMTRFLEEIENHIQPSIQNSKFKIQNSFLPPQPPTPQALPLWTDELYLELHRGCWTTHADQKWYNRRCEDLLVQAEIFSAIATLTANHPYPHKELTQAWKQSLFNQFHDILPGTAIPEVFVTANQDWAIAKATAEQVLEEAIATLTQAITWPQPPFPEAIPVAVFNSLNWERTEVVTLSLPEPETQVWQVLDTDSQSVPYQLSQVRPEVPPGVANQRPPLQDVLLFVATDVPPVGYRLYWLIPHKDIRRLGETECNPTSVPDTLGSADASPNLSSGPEGTGARHCAPTSESPWQIVNESLTAEICPKTGDLLTLRSSASAQSLLRAPGNQLQAFQDKGQYWDAWNIAPDYENHLLDAPVLKSITWVEQGPVRLRLRVIKQLGDSTIQQDYMLDACAQYLTVETEVDWRACQVVLKASFPLNLDADQVTAGIPFGAIARPLKSDDPHQQAKWEIPAWQWADLSRDEQGLSLLTDYKHGVDAKPDQLRLTLLKAPLWPDPGADRGFHQFRYGLLPHGGDWRQVRTPQRAIAFGQPMTVVIGNAANPPVGAQGIAPTQKSFLSLAATPSDWRRLNALKTQPRVGCCGVGICMARAVTFRYKPL
jgi:alpha-mannosidase